MEFHGKVIQILEPRKGVSAQTGNTWVSQDFVVEHDGRYPTRICFNAFGEQRIGEFNLRVGEFVTVKFDISARCVNGSWFNDVSAYRIERSQSTHTPAEYQQVQETFQQIAEEQQQQQQSDELPY